MQPDSSLEDELYREILLDHARNPHHHGTLDPHDGATDGRNPVCGDEIHLTWRLQDGVIHELAFDGIGCSISQAAASMLCDALTGKTVDEALHVVDAFHTLLVDGTAPTDLGDLEALSGVRAYPARVKCALLSWNLAKSGLSTPSIKDIQHD